MSLKVNQKIKAGGKQKSPVWWVQRAVKCSSDKPSSLHTGAPGTVSKPMFNPIPDSDVPSLSPTVDIIGTRVALVWSQKLLHLPQQCFCNVDREF